jgi:hypothetical protein
MSTKRKLLTIICEIDIERKLSDDVMALGAHGYTVTEARGRGTHGERDAAWGPSGNIRMEVICEEAVARAIAAHLEKTYFANFSMVLYMADVEVLRGGKF